jgi:hypothetical protein
MKRFKILFLFTIIFISCDHGSNRGGLLTNGNSKTWKVKELIFQYGNDSDNFAAGKAMNDPNLDIYYKFFEDENLFIYGIVKTNSNELNVGDTSFTNKTNWRFDSEELIFVTLDGLPNQWGSHPFIIQEITENTLIVHTKGLKIEFVSNCKRRLN